MLLVNIPFFANQQKLDEEGRSFAEESLALDPDQSISLGILGFAAFSERDYESSIDYFSRLLSSQNPSPEERAMLETYIDRARVLGSKPSNEVDDLERKSTTSIPVRVSLPLDANFSGDETLFLSVRESNSNSKIPILPYLLLVLMLIFRPRGLYGIRDVCWLIYLNLFLLGLLLVL